LIKRFSRSRKAISPILATLLLIVIAVAAIVVTYAWIMTYMGGLTRDVRLFKAQVNFNGNGTNIDIDIGNSGSTSTTIIKVYVGTSETNMSEQTPTQQSYPIILPGKGIVTITLNYTWTKGQIYYFKIISPDQILPSWAEQA
jgi:flagellin-like protein